MECVLVQAIIQVGRKTAATFLLLNFSLLCGAFKDQIRGQEMRLTHGKSFFFYSRLRRCFMLLLRVHLMEG